MKIYTKTGDQGTTSLLGGKRVSKYSLRIESYGTIDELNAHVGLLNVQLEELDILEKVQNILFDIGSLLASEEPSKFDLRSISDSDVSMLEDSIDAMNENLSPLRNFILPGGSIEACQAHLCRCVCRRAERRITALSEEEDLDPNIVVFVNRLSDWFFVLSRSLNKKVGIDDKLWIARH